MIPCRKELARGTYHIDEDLVVLDVQPAEALEAVFNDS
jgi:hypothetical protein